MTNKRARMTKSSPAYGHSADAVIPLWELYNVEAVSSARLI
jgi:hypothetical protein